MKNIILHFSLLVSLLFSCKSEVKDLSSKIKDEPPVERKKCKRAFKIIYGNTACLEPGIETYPIIQLEKDKIHQNENIIGKVYFSNTYLRKLSECNKIDYKLQLSISNPNLSFRKYFEENEGDTVYFKIPYDSLELLSSTNNQNNYLFKGRLTASFFKLDEVAGYDTIMPIEATIVIPKK